MDIPIYNCVWCKKEFNKNTTEPCKCFDHWIEYLCKRYIAINIFMDSESDNLNISPTRFTIPAIPYSTNLNKAWELITALIDYSGSCPALIYNDFGKWAVSGDGMQSCPTDEDETISTTFIIEYRYWFHTPELAICYFFVDIAMNTYQDCDMKKLLEIKQAKKEYNDYIDELDRKEKVQDDQNINMDIIRSL